MTSLNVHKLKRNKWNDFYCFLLFIVKKTIHLTYFNYKFIKKNFFFLCFVLICTVVKIIFMHTVILNITLNLFYNKL